MSAPGQTTAGRPKRARPKGSTRRTRSRTSAAAIRRKELGARVLELRKEGHAIRAIAGKLKEEGKKASKSEVQRLLVLELQSVGATKETKQQARALELERLDDLLLGLWLRARGGDEKAVAQVLKIEERRAKVLGTDAPTEQRVRLTVTGQLNWILDLVAEECGDDAAQRIYRRIAEAAGEETDSPDEEDDDE